MRHWFDAPIIVREGAGKQRAISSVEEAARWLLGDWPTAHAGAGLHLAARKACLVAMEGGDIDAARDAFLLAARAAGISVE